ncbi:MAG TPA: TIGR01777 family oxidoreductase [Polyangiaceae bacterium]|nr:TIGR01777 family oxidoreductase [Polyangiaceae bacterium]
MLRIVLTGATGFIGGKVLERLLARGDSVTALTRKVPVTAMPAGVRWVKWEPRENGEWQRELDGHDAVIHLAGETAAGRRYNDAVRREILESRVLPTERIVTGMAQVPNPPRVLVCASGVGYYGSHEDRTPLAEDASPGSDFLAQVCLAWEGAARSAEGLGARVVSARIGFVLGHGGALAKMLPLFKSFIGGKLGDGKQMVSWIHVNDVAGAMLHALDTAALRGPMNTVAPNAVDNAELTATLGRVLGRPAVLPAPGFALRALFGDGAEPLLGGQHVVPRALLETGYRFQFTELSAALTDLLGSE